MLGKKDSLPLRLFWGLEQPFKNVQVASSWLPATCFPAGQGGRINAKQKGTSHPAHSPAGTRPNKPGRKPLRLGKGVVAKEGYDTIHEMHLGLNSARFPIENRSGIHPDLSSSLPLEKSQIQPPFPDVVTDGHKGLRIPRFLAVRSDNRQVVERQRSADAESVSATQSIRAVALHARMLSYRLRLGILWSTVPGLRQFGRTH